MRLGVLARQLEGAGLAWLSTYEPTVVREPGDCESRPAASIHSNAIMHLDKQMKISIHVQDHPGAAPSKHSIHSKIPVMISDSRSRPTVVDNAQSPSYERHSPGS